MNPEMQGTAGVVARSPARKRRPRPVLRMVVMLALIGLLGAGFVAFQTFKAGIIKQVIHTITSQLPTVSTAAAQMSPWQAELSATGTLRASRGADLAPEVAGIVDAIHFTSGEDVAAGTLLLRLRPNDDDAKLAQLVASADLAEVTYQRDLKQLRVQGVAQAVVDSDAANLRAARAQVDAQKAVMDEKLVRAPFTGRLGIRQVDLGQFLPAGTTVVTLQALDPIYVDFYLPQSALASLAVGAPVRVSVDGYPGRRFTGTLSALAAKIDTSSRMIQVRATLANPDKALLPGMFATATVTVGAPEQHVTIPLAAVSYNPYGAIVYVVHDEGTGTDGKPKRIARQQFVTTGATRGDQVAILKGLAAGDVVVTAGQLKLRNNEAVLVNNAVQPTDEANPSPPDE
jgi:membrane fusion protein (multidrug efflux system)